MKTIDTSEAVMATISVRLELDRKPLKRERERGGGGWRIAIEIDKEREIEGGNERREKTQTTDKRQNKNRYLIRPVMPSNTDSPQAMYSSFCKYTPSVFELIVPRAIRRMTRTAAWLPAFPPAPTSIVRK